jgi:protein phosphatase
MDEELPDMFREIILSANQAILDLRSQMGDNDMGCTLTATLVRGANALVANIGDSRTYRMRQGKLMLVTQDHSLVARLVEQGLLQPEEVYTHFQRNMIYRSLGVQPTLDVDVFTLELEPGERLLLCSDGLWEMVRDGMIEEVLLERYDPQQACDRLVELANLAGGEDNVSVIVLNVKG